MELPDDILALYTAEVESGPGGPAVAVPQRELEVGDVAVGETYRIAILPARAGNGASPDDERASAPQSNPGEPPVEEGEVREVEIEDVGDQGDGIARIGPGYVVFVPETTVGDRVTVEISQARENFAFAEVVEGEPLSD